jgi:hypothetical protein
MPEKYIFRLTFHPKLSGFDNAAKNREDGLFSGQMS